ncbi:MAG TPA: Fur family transcriptional regulator [Mycobacteriales bacterium]|nr:Fur family transcriptional regulator [Mycobacteriales bacterium]
MSAPASGRSTRQRTAVSDVLARVDGFRSAQELHELLRRGGSPVGLTTVYRHLLALADQGLVDVLRTPDGEAVYRRCASQAHHHHLVCRSCSRSVEVEGPEVEAWAVSVAGRHGFVDVGHTVEVFGTCSTCAG